MDAVLRRRRDLLARPLQDDLVMADLETGNYFGLSGTARAVWDALAEPVTVADVCAGLAERYDVDAATCQRDVQTFVDELTRHGLVEIVG